MKDLTPANKHLFTITLTSVISFFLSSTGAFSQNNSKAAEAMAQMLQYSAPGNNHKLLQSLAGEWNFRDAKLAFVKGTLSRKAIYNGRFCLVIITGGKLKVPIANGEMKEENYQSMQIEGYDNPRKAFVTTSINNHIGSDIQEQTGVYDAGKKQFTYTWESLLLPTAAVTNKRVLSIVDDNHYKEEFFEVQDGLLVKIRELDYERAK